ncbi:MAG: penicillin acylase family protein [Bacteroidota bacterium]|nr:MAG: penicillin acylase family protein [Bacteroidota bacterium]
MNRLKKILLILLTIVFVVVLFGFILIQLLSRRALPQYEGQIKLTGLTEKVEVFRDSTVVAHIVAANEADLYRAVGYTMAQDRLWQMDLLRRITLGRLSEIFGDSFVETDLLLRSLEYSNKSKELLTQTPEHVVLALEAFSDGVNQYISQLGKKLPIEFTLLKYQPEPWESYQSLNLIGYMAWDLKSGWNELLLEQLKSRLDSALYAELLPDNKLPFTPVFDSTCSQLLASNALLQLEKLNPLGADVFCGSNNWAVSGKKSTTGKPILANDMHLSYSVPGIWLQMHQQIPGRLNVSGLVLPGQPLIIVGHNDSIAWGMTNTYVDNLDFYEEKINPENANQYFFNGQWLDFEISKESIKSSSGSVFERTYRRTHRGPVVSEAKGITDRVLSIRWVGDEPSNEILCMYKTNRANNWTEFKDAFSTFRSVSQNIAYADASGNIGLYACAGVPVRKRNAVFEVLPGWTDEYDWKGLLPFDSLPHEYNPERGYVSSANNKTTGPDYPYHIGTWYGLPYRIDRIRQMLDEKDLLSADDFTAIQNDFQSEYARLFIEKLLPFIDVSSKESHYKKAFEELSEWNGSMDKELVAPTLFETSLVMLVENTYRDELGDSLYNQFIQNNTLVRQALYALIQKGESGFVDNVLTDEVESLSDVMTNSFTQAVDYLAEKYGKNTSQWEWGQLHQLTLSHPLSKVKILDMVFNFNRGPFAVSGSFHTVAPYSFSGLKFGEVYHGASHRNIFTPGNWDQGFGVIPGGNSGHIRSEFYMDQVKDYINGKYYKEVFSDEQVKTRTKYYLELLPVEE